MATIPNCASNYGYFLDYLILLAPLANFIFPIQIYATSSLLDLTHMMAIFSQIAEF